MIFASRAERLLWVGTSLISMCSAGCGLDRWAKNGFKVGPNYTAPQASVASEWLDQKNPLVKTEDADLRQWWQVFSDPALSSLIDSAVQKNLTLRGAAERIVEARAIRDIDVGQLFPQSQQATAGFKRLRLSQESGFQPGLNIPFAGSQRYFSSWNAGFNLTWEIDLWGRYRRAIESADAELEASVAGYDDVLVVLYADVASSYVQYRTFQERLTYARQNVEIQSKSYTLAQDRAQGGAATERDVQQAKQRLEQTQAAIPQLEIGLRQANNALCVLLAIPPADLEQRLGSAGKVPATPAQLAVGVPANLLRRRADVRRAERQVAAQSARIGVAESELFPHLALLGDIGVSASKFDDLGHTPKSIAGSIGPSARWDILNYGRLENGVKAQESRFRQAALEYQSAVLRAGREAEDAMISFVKTRQQAEHLTASVAAARRGAEIVSEQYRAGAVDFTPLFLAQATLAEQEDSLAVTRGQIALSLINVYKALGGGWEGGAVRAKAGTPGSN
jgi:NodT family efflux transporter outer membrane factor (OMF) lipoprotein